MNVDSKVLTPLILARKKLIQTINVFPEYPYVIPEVLKFAIPVTNTDVKPGCIELCIEEAKGFPSKEVSIKGILPIVINNTQTEVLL